MSEFVEAGPRDTSDREPAVMLLTAWHLARARSMPRAFWRIRALDRHTRGVEGCLWAHRWVSRRSLLLTTHWASEADAERWLRSEAFRAFDAGAMALGDSRRRIERYRPAG